MSLEKKTFVLKEMSANDLAQFALGLLEKMDISSKAVKIPLVVVVRNVPLQKTEVDMDLYANALNIRMVTKAKRGSEAITYSCAWSLYDRQKFFSYCSANYLISQDNRRVLTEARHYACIVDKQPGNVVIQNEDE